MEMLSQLCQKYPESLIEKINHSSSYNRLKSRNVKATPFDYLSWTCFSGHPVYLYIGLVCIDSSLLVTKASEKIFFIAYSNCQDRVQRFITKLQEHFHVCWVCWNFLIVSYGEKCQLPGTFFRMEKYCSQPKLSHFQIAKMHTITLREL